MFVQIQRLMNWNWYSWQSSKYRAPNSTFFSFCKSRSNLYHSYCCL